MVYPSSLEGSPRELFTVTHIIENSLEFVCAQMSFITTTQIVFLERCFLAPRVKNGKLNASYGV